MKRTRCRRWLPLFALAAGLAFAPSGAGAGVAAKDLTNELIHGRALEGRPAVGFVWSPAGDRFVFTQRSGSGKDDPPLLRLYDTATRKITQLTSEEGVRKLTVASPQWSPDGTSLLVLSGDDLYLIGVPRSGALPDPRRLTSTDAEEKDPKFSPDGTQIGFVRDHDLFVIDVSPVDGKPGAERALTRGGTEEVTHGEVDWVYDEEFDLASAWWWSSDGGKVAYLEFDERAVPAYPIVDWLPTHPETQRQRYPKAGDPNPILRLGVVRADKSAAAAAVETTWIDLGVEKDIYIPRVAWTPRGSLAVVRMDRTQARLELLLCPPTADACRTLLEEKDPHWLNIDDDARYFDDHFIWGSERDGFHHLYTYDYEGRQTGRVTRGSWAVTDLALARSSGPIYFTATEKSALERHLYRANRDGSGLTRLTREEGWHTTWIGGASGAGAMFLDGHSTANQPTRVTLRRLDGTVVDTIDEGLAGDLADYRRGRVEFRTVTAPDGTALPASITLPPDFDPARKYPVLVYVYGGPHAQVVTNQWVGPRGLWHQMMAARGIIVWSLDNRGMGGRGHAWETPLHLDMGRRELEDQLTGVEWLRKQPFVDASHIGLWGWSYGGYMTLYSLVNAPKVFRAGAAVAPVTTWKDYDTIYTERYMRRPADNPKGYVDSAPLEKAAALEAPLLLVHGSADDNVHLQNSVQMLDALVKAGRPVDFMLYPGKNHGIPGRQARTHVYEKITRFFTEHLLGAGPS